jgi:hypothetical protein
MTIELPTQIVIEPKKKIVDELERLGWTTNKKKKRLRAIKKSQLLKDNETYKDLVKMPGISRSSIAVELSL